MKELFLLGALLGAGAIAGEPPATVLPEFELTAVTVDRTRVLRRKDMLGKVWIANFMFTRCHGPCPVNSGKMQVLQQRLPSDILLASFTVDPAYDQAKALRAYAKKFRAQPGRWMFLTAKDEETLIPLFKDTFRTAYKPNPDAACGFETYHSGKFFLIDGKGAIRGTYASEDNAQMARLEADAKALSGAKS
jgi:protein SCO1